MMNRKQIIEKAQGDDARLFWTLDCGASPMSRIYSTMKHLRSQMGRNEIESLVNRYVKDGIILTTPHPLHPNEWFYSLSKDEP